MRSERTAAALAAACIGIAAVLIPRFAGWAPPERSVEFAGLVAAAILAASLGVQGQAATNRAIMPPAFIVVFAALMLFGPQAAVFVAAAAALTPAFVTGRASRVQSLIDTLRI